VCIKVDRKSGLISSDMSAAQRAAAASSAVARVLTVYVPANGRTMATTAAAIHNNDTAAFEADPTV
jgi:hypothetical protein